MLCVALDQLLRDKSIEEISVADIAAQSGLNRGTFYDHYPDKFALLEDLVDSRFQDLLTQRNISFDGTCGYALARVVLATCDYLADSPQSQAPNKRQMEKHFEAAIVSVIRGMVLSGLNQHPPVNGPRPELAAASISGAIYGAARSGPATPALNARKTSGMSSLKCFGRCFSPMRRDKRAGTVDHVLRLERFASEDVFAT